MNRINEENQRNQSNLNKTKKRSLFGRKDKVVQRNRSDVGNNVKNNNVDNSNESWNLPIQPKNNSNSKRNTNSNSNRNTSNSKPNQNNNSNNKVVRENYEKRNTDVRVPNNTVKTQPQGNNERPSQRPHINSSQRNSGNVKSTNNHGNKRSHDSKRNHDSKRKENSNYKELRVYKQEDLIGKKNRNNNNRRTQFYVSLTAFIILLYFGSNIYRMFAGDGVAEMQLEKTVVDTPKVYDGLILRNEVLTKATTDGEVEYKVANNEKARVNELVAQIVTGDQVVQNVDISSEEFTAANKVHNTDIENINSRIKSEFSYSKIQDYSQAYVYADKIYESMEIRNQIILSEMDASATAKDTSTVKEQFYTSVSGVVSYDLDSYEEIYTLEGIDEIDEDDIKTVSKANTAVRSKIVSAGDVVFKVLTDNYWYIVAYIDNEEVKSRGLTVGSNYELHVNKTNVYVPVMSKIESITEGDKTSKVVFKCDSYSSDFADERSVSFKLAKDNIEGFKVPTTAIKQKEAIVINNDYIFFNEEKGYDYVVKQGYDGESYEVPIVKYKTENANTYVLKEDTELSKGDMLIKEGEIYQIPDIYMINGVYVLNTGVVTFKEVKIYEGALDDASVVFLESSENQNVRIHDTIAVDVNEISEDEIIR